MLLRRYKDRGQQATKPVATLATVEETQGGEGGKGEMTVKELKAYAAEKNIDFGKAKTKGEIITAIEAAEAANAGDGKPDGNDNGGEGGNE